MRITAIFNEPFEVDEDSDLTPEEQGVEYLQGLLNAGHLKVNGDSLYEVIED